MSEPIIDAHHHVWQLDRVPWLKGPQVPRIFGDYGALRRDYPVSEYREALRPHGVVASVYVQINVAPGDEVEEVRWVQSAADAEGFPHGIVAYADLAQPDVGATLDRQLAFANLRGIRQQLHWHERSLYRFAARPDLTSDPAWRRGLAELERRGLLFELQVFAAQMPDAARLASDFPGITFVLLHAGMLEDRTMDGWAHWREGMRLLAACPNVQVKLSGLGTFEHECSVESWKPVIVDTIGMFGPQRCIFGSNYPIESLWTSYDRIIEVMQACVAPCTPAERRAIFHDNAKRVYRL